jgi:hypothetical protein
VAPKIGEETLRSLLKEEGVRLRRTKTWKESNDPVFRIKKNTSIDSRSMFPRARI